jgi:hypothetical protein
MIRTRDERGSVVIGLLRGPLLDRFLAGERVCLPEHTDANGLHHPHVCLFLRDTNEELLQAVDVYFPDGPLPGARFEHVTTEEPGGAPKRYGYGGEGFPDVELEEP